MQESQGISGWLIAFIVSMLFLIGTGIYAFWAYSQYTDQRDNVDDVVAAAVENAEAAQEEQLRAEFAEESKSPLTTYNGPAAMPAANAITTIVVTTINTVFMMRLALTVHLLNKISRTST